MQVGEIRFLTKVASNSPRGLRLMLFKEKVTGNEKLVFIVKTASEDVDRLALSRMTWQVEQSKTANRVVIVRLIILPEGANQYFQSETGLLMNEEKDRKTLQSLVNQKSVEIYFFNYENEFNSKIELMTTYNMHSTAKALLEANPIIDEGRMIVKSENLSENDIKNAMTGKINIKPVEDKDLMDSIQKKMPTVGNSTPKTKPEEFNKTSIKSNDIITPGTYGNTTSSTPSKSTGFTVDDLKKAVSVPPGKITPEELLRSLPPNKELGDSIRSGELFKTATTTGSVNKSQDNSSIQADDLMKVVNSMPPGKITPEELLKTIPPSSNLNINDTNSPEKSLTSEELLKSLTDTISIESAIQTNKIAETINKDELNLKNLSEAMKVDDYNDNKEKQVDDLMYALMSETSPLKLSAEEESALLTDLMSEPTPLKSSEGENSELMKNLESNIKTTAPVNNQNPGNVNDTKSIPNLNDTRNILNRNDEGISASDLLKALNGES